jgi:hypothetical protein
MENFENLSLEEKSRVMLMDYSNGIPFSNQARPLTLVSKVIEYLKGNGMILTSECISKFGGAYDITDKGMLFRDNKN